MWFRKVLLCTDFSIPARLLTQSLPELQRMGMEEVVLLNVVESDSGKEISRELQQHSLQKLEEMAQPLQEAGLRTKCMAPLGDPAEMIVHVARAEEVSLTLIGSHGIGFVKRIFLGSTAADLIRTTPSPLLIEKYVNIHDDTCAVVCPEKFRKILLPLDFSSHSLETVKKVREMGPPVEEVVLLAAIEYSKTEEIMELMYQEIQQQMQHINDSFKEAGYQVTVRLREGTASRNIMEIAEQEGGTLIALSKRGGGKIRELLIGSTAENVARRSRTPVLLLPAQPRE